ncbi:hypothetical protein CAPTEDRAFT_226185 [Capitella teleta]|uniref:C2H2-type domain-containing protein n=1 Tax=Capitella teleta TaxID=283909 RepID=R7V8M5_CAPTE|nr:hypothetical protein CAPTEDRAFT_226185 [Capitella teleta]|eukprot:ELU12691.1 hypothetical protein CAPTEDRAFT_226185 [Capitella teleta]
MSDSVKNMMRLEKKEVEFKREKVTPRRSVRERTIIPVRDLLGIKTRKRKNVEESLEEQIEIESPHPRDEPQLLVDEDSADESIPELKTVKSEEDVILAVEEIVGGNAQAEEVEQETGMEEKGEALSPVALAATLSGEEREAVASVIAEYQENCAAQTVFIIQGESGEPPIVLRLNGEEEEGEVQSYTVITEDPEVVKDGQMFQVDADVPETDQPSTSTAYSDQITQSSEIVKQQYPGIAMATEVSEAVEETDSSDVLFAPITEQDISEVNPKTGRCKPAQHLVATSNLQSLVNQIKADVDLSQHVQFCKNYNRGTMQCRHCKEMISNRHAFRAHMRTKHSDLQFKPFKCPLCDYRAEVKASVARHINVHSAHKPYACTVCGRGFAFKQKLQIHMKYHRNVRDQICPLCKMAFHEHNTLKAHLSKVHGMSNPGEFLQQMKNTKSLWKIAPAEEKDQHEEGLTASEVINLVSAGEAEQQEAQEEQGEREPAGKSVQILSFPVQRTSNMIEENTAKESNAVLMPHSAKSVIKNTSRLEMRTKAYKESKEETAAHVSTATTNQSVHPPFKIKSKATPLVSDHHLYMDPITSKSSFFLSAMIIDFLISPPAESEMNVNPPNKVFAKCKLCSDIMFCKSQFFTHMELQHPEIKAWGCPQCPYKSRGRPAILTHLKIHIGKKNHKCSICSKAFLHKHKLTSHMRIHENLRNIKCTLCPRAFNETNDLTKHIRQVHVGLRLYECESCGKKFKDSSQLRSHILTHDLVKRAECEVCHKMYKSAASLKQHMKGHACIFHCDICDRSFGSYSGFMAHKVMHDESRDYEGFDCPKCDAVLLTKGSFNRHLKVVHSDVRRFICEVCNSAFKSRKDLNNHCLIHLKEKQFKCSICALPCRSAESLRVHMLRHSAWKPYTCRLCGKTYTQKHALQMHLAHHNKGDQCLYCNTIIHNRIMMHAHMRMEHMTELEQDSARSEPDQAATAAAVAAGTPTQNVLTVYMCVECQNVCLSKEALNNHMLQVHGIEQQQEDAAADEVHNQVTTESQVSISSPSGNAAERVVTLVHPVAEDSEETQAQKDNVVTFTDPNTSLQYIVPVNANSLLSGLTGNGLESLEIDQQEKGAENVVVYEEVEITEEVKTTEEEEEAGAEGVVQEEKA